MVPGKLPTPAPLTAADLASRWLGGSVMAASDESFGEKEHLLSPAPAAFEPGRFGPRGQVVDGWETRRRREAGHDWAMIRLGAPGISRGDDRRYALRVLNTLFGGSSSSRLFREVREKRGLAYSVGSYNEQFTDQGLVATYVGTREDNVEEACSIIGVSWRTSLASVLTSAARMIWPTVTTIWAL